MSSNRSCDKKKVESPVTTLLNSSTVKNVKKTMWRSF